MTASGLAATKKCRSRRLKQPTKVMVWGTMSLRDLSDLHIVPEGKLVYRTAIYVEEVRTGTAALAMRRQTENGSPTAAKLLPDMPQDIFSTTEPTLTLNNEGKVSQILPAIYQHDW